jgi:hypothetical protein
MENSDAVSDALLDAAASSTFEDHDNGFGEPIRFRCSTNSAPGRSRHHPVGRDPTTFASSMRSTIPVSPTRRSGTRAPSARPTFGDTVVGIERGQPLGDGQHVMLGRMDSIVATNGASGRT